MKRLVVAPLLLAACLLAGCDGGNELHEVTAERYAQWADISGQSPTWPLTVDPVKIDCLGQNGLAVVADGESYWLNGRGKELADKFDLVDPDPIWADDPATGKVPLGGLTAYGLSVCN